MTLTFEIAELGSLPEGSGVILIDARGDRTFLRMTRAKVQEFAAKFPIYSEVLLTFAAAPEPEAIP